MNASEIVIMFLQLAVLLGFARICGAIAQRFGQPAICGEILAGVILGRSFFHRIFPEASASVFPIGGGNATFLSGFNQFSVVLFLLAAGLDIQLSELKKHAKAAMAISVSGILIPFGIGILCAYGAPEMMGYTAKTDVLPFILFFATALSISALPVVVKTLMDLGLLRSKVGMVTVTAAVFEDLVGWIVFACILTMINHSTASALSIPMKIVATIGFALGALFLLKPFVRWALPRISEKTSFVLILTFLAAATTEWIGVHALFGAVMVGFVFGESPEFPEENRAAIHELVGSFFGPLFFGMIGLKVDFVANFDLRLTAVVIAVACVSKLLGGGLAARWAGFTRNESLAIGFAMNSRGAMEIILGLLALQVGLIDERLFVALVAMALFTSMLSGPVVRRLLKDTVKPRPRRAKGLFKKTP